MYSELDVIVKSPRFPYYLIELQAIWDTEKQKRNAFYEQITEQQKAEFIDGEIVLHSPARNLHILVSDRLNTLLFVFVENHELGRTAHEKCLISLSRNDFEPDICFFGNEKAQKFKDGQMKHPAPDFVVEILSNSTEHTDRTIKFTDYALHGVTEYWIIDADKKTLEQYILNGEDYELQCKASNAIVESVAIKGFSLYIPALFDQNEWRKEFNRCA